MADLVNVDVAQARDLVAGGALLLDVREDAEFDLGHAPGALHVPLADVPDQLAELAKDRQIVCVCRSGGRSARAANFLMENGFNVVNLEGGMTAWAESGAPLESDDGNPVIG
ncbi:MAG: rhodanese-like domain-containing protein [Acidimicrobiales bacterium]|jgi:rhodanese-related sulfurtransferase